MNFGEDFFFRHDHALRIMDELFSRGERPKTPEELARQAKEDEAILEQIHAWRDYCRETISQEKVDKYTKIAKDAYFLAKKMHYNVSVSDTDNFSADITFQVDAIRFLKHINTEEKEIFLRLISESDIFLMEPDGDMLNICFTFNLSDALNV